jgi:hypothetical protein
MSYCSLCNWEAPILEGGTLSISYGKDSLACIGACHHLGWKINRIVHAEVWATDTIPAELPPMIEFKKKADRIIQERYGLEVEHYRADVTYEQCFYLMNKSGKREGTIWGWPFLRGPWCNSRLKVAAIAKCKTRGIEYIGIAADEPARFKTLTDPKLSPLKEIGWDEDYCGLWCKYNDLLAPDYASSYRGGCWFCHNQGVEQLRLLRRNYPQYWELLLKWDKYSPVTFKADGHTVHDYDKRFLYEEEGIVPADRTFRWDMLERPLQISFFGGLCL